MSGMRAGLACGGKVPWRVVDAREIRGKSPGALRGWTDEVCRIVVLWGVIVVRLLELLGVWLGAWRERAVDGKRLEEVVERLRRDRLGMKVE
jgi:hypothetical protein